MPEIVTIIRGYQRPADPPPPTPEQPRAKPTGPTLTFTPHQRPVIDRPVLTRPVELPPLTGDPVVDGSAVDIIMVPRSVYDAAKIGDSFVVVDTIYSGDGPEVIDDIRDWDAAVFYPRIAIALVLTLLFAVIGWRMGRRR